MDKSIDYSLLNGFAAEELAGYPANIDLTTNAGLEKVVKEEIVNKCNQAHLPIPEITLKPYHFGGHVHLASKNSLSDFLPIIQRLRSVENAILTLKDFRISGKKGLSTIASVLENLPIPALDCADTFRITTIRTGSHHFSSLDVQKIAGTVIDKKYESRVDLEEYDLEVRVDVFDNHCLVGIQLTNQSLTNRLNRSYIPRVSLKPHVAFGLIHMANVNSDKEVVLDPFCGSGTILLELNQIFPKMLLKGNDVYENVVKGAQENVRWAGAEKQIGLKQGDVFYLEELYPHNAFDFILTNPPFGIKLSKEKFFPNFYRQFISQAAKVLKTQGKLVLLAFKGELLEKVVKEDGNFKIQKVKPIEIGGIQPKAFKMVNKA